MHFLDKHPADINDKPLLDQYDYYFKYYTAKYKKCSVIFQNGSFYEFYGVDNGKDEKIGNVKEISEITLLNIGYRYPENKRERNTKENPMCAGFQTVTKSKYISFLINQGWTLVQVDQEAAETITKVGNTKKERFRRGVSIIHSPDTYIAEETTEVDNRYIVSIYVEAFTDPEFDPVAVGLSAIDVTTGETRIYETYNSKDDQNYAFDEITRFIQSHSPKHVLFYSTFSVDGFETNYVFNKKHACPKYQIKFLEKIYEKPTMISIHEHLGTERFTAAVTSFVSLLQYCYDHNPALLESLRKPTIFSNSNNLVLTNNAVSQLDLVNGESFKFGSIFNLVNFTSTAMGHRLLKYRLLYPITSCEELEKRYSMIKLLWDEEKPIQEILKKICDLEKCIRNVSERNLKHIIHSLFYIDKLCKTIKDFQLSIDISPKFTDLITWLKENVDRSTDILFTSEKLREMTEIQNTCTDYFSKIKKRFEDTVNGPVEMILSDEEGCRFKFTNAKHKMVANDVVVISFNKSYKYCTTEKLKTVSFDYTTACEDYNKEYKRILREFTEKFNSFRKVIMSAIHFTAQVDVVVSSVVCAKTFNYCKPKVISGKSFISSKQIRHPIIERINNSIYVPHDISFGASETVVNQTKNTSNITSAQIHTINGTEHQSASAQINGMLLYGFNASGKSSLMKTIGVNLILAQAGLFVAAKSFKFSPYTNIQTRILSNDNMQKGLSSFAVELSELRGILSRSDDSSLILGDEISKGTESISGVAIVAAAIIGLMAKGSHFLFATHLHQLAELTEIKKLCSSGLSIFHLQVERDKKTNALVYKRDLQPGCGDSLYGLEVARAMKLPQEFLDQALIIRKEILKQYDILGKATPYNSEMFLHSCGVCGESAVEVHHIRAQCEADENGFIDHFHKNNLRNLVGLCTKCHKKVTYGKLTITKWIESSEGVTLEYY